LGIHHLRPRLHRLGHAGHPGIGRLP
jgi:hypothetical protein